MGEIFMNSSWSMTDTCQGRGVGNRSCGLGSCHHQAGQLQKALPGMAFLTRTLANHPDHRLGDGFWKS